MTMETKFTPGPWRMETEAEPEDDSPVVYVCHAATVCDVTTICNMLPSRAASVEQRQANAHLIAAAPTMADYVRRKAEEGCDEAARIWEQINAC
jgi:hypothetical protein